MVTFTGRRSVECRCGGVMWPYMVEGQIIYFCALGSRDGGCALAWSPITEWVPSLKELGIRLPVGRVLSLKEWYNQ